jgi:hypothetical protein
MKALEAHTRLVSGSRHGSLHEAWRAGGLSRYLSPIALVAELNRRFGRGIATDCAFEIASAGLQQRHTVRSALHSGRWPIFFEEPL